MKYLILCFLLLVNQSFAQTPTATVKFNPKTGAMTDPSGSALTTWKSVNGLGGGGGLGGNVLIVDAAGHGQYTTITAAVAAVTSGQTIYVMPGNYTDGVLTNTTPFNMHFEPGAIWNSSTGRCVDDHSGAITVGIDGFGEFYGGASNDAVNGNGTFFIANPASVLRVKGKICDSVGSGAACSGAIMYYDFQELGTAANAQAVQWPAIWWGQGEIHASGRLLQNGTGDYSVIMAIDGGGMTGIDWLYCDFDHITEGGNGILNGGSGPIGATQRVSIRSALISGNFLGLSTGLVYINAQKMEGAGGPVSVDVEGATLVQVTTEKFEGTLTCGAGNAYLQTQTLEDTAGTGQPYLTVSGGNAYVGFQTCTNSVAGTSLFSVSGGLLQLEGGDFTAVAGQTGSVCSGGVTRISCRVDMSAVAGVNPVNIQTGSTPIVILEPAAKLITDGTAKSIVRDTGTITVIGQGYGNVGVGTGVTATNLTVISGLK